MMILGFIYASAPWFYAAVHSGLGEDFMATGAGEWWGEFIAPKEGVRLHSDVIVYCGTVLGCFEWAAEAVAKAELTTVDSITALIGSTAGVRMLSRCNCQSFLTIYTNPCEGGSWLVEFVAGTFDKMPFRLATFWGWLFQHYNRLRRGTDYNRFLKQASFARVVSQFFNGWAIPEANE